MTELDATKLLIEKVQQGESEALDELCNRYQVRVLAAVRARLGAKLRQKVESWDIVQEVLIDALRKVDSFDFNSEGAFLKFLNQVVENRIRDEADRWRAKKRDADREVPLRARRENDSQSFSHVLADKNRATPSGVLALSEDLERLEAAIDRLPDDYRELVIAVKLEGRTLVEIAGDVGKSPDAVRMQLNRAMVALTKEFRAVDTERGD